MCNLCHATEVLFACLGYQTLKRVVIAICTTLQRQLLRPKNAWYFYIDISAGSNGNLSGKREEFLAAESQNSYNFCQTKTLETLNVLIIYQFMNF